MVTTVINAFFGHLTCFVPTESSLYRTYFRCAVNNNFVVNKMQMA